MKVCIIGDIHWSTYSSILRSRSTHFSVRLENLMQSLSWVEHISEEYGCDEEVFLGDFFDKPDLNSEEITALSEVQWNKSSRLKHFIVGNHESGLASLKYNSTQILHKVGVVEDTPYLYPLDDKTEFLFLPYITEDNRKPLSEYLKNRNLNKKLIIFSHNDLKDFQMGQFKSTTGFSIDDIESSCDLFINGHLHNGSWVTKKILNLGNLTGQNFSEDGFRYKHNIAILDTDTLEVKLIENPYAINFYKIDVDTWEDLIKISKVKPNSVLSIKCKDILENNVKEMLKEKQVLESRIVLSKEVLDKSSVDISKLKTIDHLDQFKNYILQTCGNSDIVLSEVYEVCKNIS